MLKALQLFEPFKESIRNQTFLCSYFGRTLVSAKFLFRPKQQNPVSRAHYQNYIVRRVRVRFWMGMEGRKAIAAIAIAHARCIAALAFTILYRKMAPPVRSFGWMEH